VEERELVFAAIATIIVAAGIRLSRRIDPKRARTYRRGAGHAMLGLQQFIEPSVEHVFQAQNVEQDVEDDGQGLGIDEPAVRAGLAEALARSPVDSEEIRRHLTGALRLGLDWRALFEQAVERELNERPYRAPSVPPANRVRPLE
jgi:hypothetical protein